MKPSLRTWSAVSAAALLLLMMPAAAQDAEPRVAPANNDFANRTVVSARGMMNGSYTVSTAQDATFQAGEPDPSCTSGTTISDTVWYEFTAPHDIHLVIDTAGSSLNNGASSNTAIAVYSSSSGSPTLATLSEEYCSTGGSGAGWATWFPLDAGTYYVQVGSEV